MSKPWIFVVGAVLGLVLVLGSAGRTRAANGPRIEIAALTGEISVTEQLQPAALRTARTKGYRTVIGLRPDGEAPDQPSSSQMREAAAKEGVGFVYVPVKHGDIPDATVKQLAAALEKSPGPILMYCRSGRRAARTWSLVEASRPHGMDGTSIMDTVRQAGQSADDLQEAIAQRIKARAAREGAAQ